MDFRKMSLLMHFRVVTIPELHFVLLLRQGGSKRTYVTKYSTQHSRVHVHIFSSLKNTYLLKHLQHTVFTKTSGTYSSSLLPVDSIIYFSCQKKCLPENSLDLSDSKSERDSPTHKNIKK